MEEKDTSTVIKLPQVREPFPITSVPILKTDVESGDLAWQRQHAAQPTLALPPLSLPSRWWLPADPPGFKFENRSCAPSHDSGNLFAGPLPPLNENRQCPRAGHLSVFCISEHGLVATELARCNQKNKAISEKAAVTFMARS